MIIKLPHQPASTIDRDYQVNFWIDRDDKFVVRDHLLQDTSLQFATAYVCLVGDRVPPVAALKQCCALVMEAAVTALLQDQDHARKAGGGLQ